MRGHCMIEKMIINRLRSLADETNRVMQARFGIATATTLGVRVPELRAMAKELGKNHELAQKLWQSNIHEARILASMIDDKKVVTEKQMEAWVVDFNSWDVCDQVISNLFVRTPYAWQKALEWVERDQEFVRRAGFAMMAYLAVHDKKAVDEKFLLFFPLIKTYATDERNFVKKAVNWALRQIGKRNVALNKHALVVAHEIRDIDSKAARWIAADAIRELSRKQF
jgi:3-methyladenine DNA glycosylase AlkD